MDDVQCDGSEPTLLQCSHSGLLRHDCIHYEDAGVRCRREEIWLNISVDIDDVHTVLITWMLQNDTVTVHWPDSYVIECFNENEGHRVEISASNSTFSIQFVGLIPSTPYNCCVSALPTFHGPYTYERACTDKAVMVQTTEYDLRDPSLIAIIIGGVLGFIIVILLLSLVVTILCLCTPVRSRFSKTTNIPKRYGTKQVVYSLLKLYNFISNNNMFTLQQ